MSGLRLLLSHCVLNHGLASANVHVCLDLPPARPTGIEAVPETRTIRHGTPCRLAASKHRDLHAAALGPPAAPAHPDEEVLLPEVGAHREEEVALGPPGVRLVAVAVPLHHQAPVHLQALRVPRVAVLQMGMEVFLGGFFFSYK
jgi:hypothetical protein